MVLVTICLCACTRRAGLNFDCDWVPDDNFTIDLGSGPHVRHLLDDIRAAEELAIRYGDRIAGWRLVDTFGIVSRHGGLENRDAGRLAHQRCLAALFTTIASTHAVSVDEIEGARPRLAERGMDLAVTLPIAFLFAFGVRQLIRWLRSRFASDEVLGWVIATIIGSIVLTTVVLALGAGWAVLVEIVRTGNEHLSYRARSASLRDNFVVMFALGIALSWISSAIAATRPAIDGRSD